MKVAIMQPYFMPYIGYFSLIKQTDRFILLDKVQYIRHGWIERNRMLKFPEGWLYIQVPLQKRRRETIIQDIYIDNSQVWKQKIMAQLQTYKKNAPFYNQTIDVLSNVFSRDYTTITELNAYAIKTICSYLEIQRPIEVFSEMNIDIETPKEPDEWALYICKSIGNVCEYWNPIGGKDFFDTEKYTQAGIEIKFQNICIEPYKQKRDLFEPSLSVLDVMMFNSIEQIHSILDNYEIV